MRGWIIVGLSAIAAVTVACKKSSVASTPDATATTTDASARVAAVASAKPADAGPRKTWKEYRDEDLMAKLGMSVAPMRGAIWAMAVYSRVDNDSESPVAMVDQNLDTAWSSKTGDLEGAWVAIELGYWAKKVRAIHMTIGMTKEEDKDLFVQNPRISEVRVTYDGKTIVERFAFDLESRKMQRIPLPDDLAVKDKGELRVIVTKVKLGTKTTWREVSISELALEGKGQSEGAVMPDFVLVGSLKPTARGKMKLVPELTIPPQFSVAGTEGLSSDGTGCRALLPRIGRVYCVLGQWGTMGTTSDFVTIDKKDGVTTLAEMEVTSSSFDTRLPFKEWREAEQALKKEGQSLEPSGEKKIPYKGELEIEGATFRQRETWREETPPGEQGPPEYMRAVLEVRWSAGENGFTKVFDDKHMTATSPIEATVRPLGPKLWLVERRMGHGSEGTFGRMAQAALCDDTAKTCTVYQQREIKDP